MEKIQLIARYIRAFTFALDTFLNEVKKIKEDENQNNNNNNVHTVSTIPFSEKSE